LAPPRRVTPAFAQSGEPEDDLEDTSALMSRFGQLDDAQNAIYNDHVDVDTRLRALSETAARLEVRPPFALVDC
jgi:hypothetical protein